MVGQQVVLVRWENNVPIDYEFENDMEYVLNKFCNEMCENFTIIGKYSEHCSDNIRVVQKDSVMFLEVTKCKTIFFIPIECLDVKELINIIDREYGELIVLM